MVEDLDDLATYFQKLEKEKTGKEMSDQESREASDNLVGFFDLLLKIDRRLEREKKNKEISKK